MLIEIIVIIKKKNTERDKVGIWFFLFNIFIYLKLVKNHCTLKKKKKGTYPILQYFLVSERVLIENFGI